MILCEQYYEGDAVQACCEGCRQVRCPRVIDVLFASPKGGSVEEKAISVRVNSDISVRPKRAAYDHLASASNPSVSVVNQTDYL
jgi:hypothetical protein